MPAKCKHLFSRGTAISGHHLAVPEVGNFHTLPAGAPGPRAGQHTPKGVELISNVCRHRQALILRARQLDNQGGGNIVCPLHRWTYAAADSRTTAR